jgi:CheY-like chemotaxis protein
MAQIKNGNRPKILLVDDEEIVRILLTEYLDDLDTEVDVFEADNGRSAIEAIRLHGAPDVIISDIMMPDMDGFALLDRMKSDPTTTGIPFMVITADDQPETRERAFRMGASDFVLKPLAQDSFVARVQKFVSTAA